MLNIVHNSHSTFYFITLWLISILMNQSLVYLRLKAAVPVTSQNHKISKDVDSWHEEAVRPTEANFF